MSDDALVGGDILRLVTAGMYDNPLVIYREYLQNAADAIASRGDRSGSVFVTIDAAKSQVTILDDGIGLSPTDAASRLVRLGNSSKVPDVDRGLRGIGRLSALAFADKAHFTTRSRTSEPVTRVSWNGRTLREIDLRRIDAKTAIEACTTIHEIADDGWPDRFFHVTVDGVTRHAASSLLNQDAVRRYIAEVCPVPLASSFPLASKLEEFLTTHTDYLALNVRIDGNPNPILRPFREDIPLSESYSAGFERLETRIIPQLDRDAPAAVLWLAHTPYAGSISRRLGIRGLRARSGNIQIGSDDIFEHLFHEARFNGWCVGEVHVVDSRIVPNGQRDYFEPGPHLRNLENHLGAVAHEISSRCRRASSQRNRVRAAATAVGRIKYARDLATSGYLRPDDATALLARQREQLPQIKQALEKLRGARLDSDLLDIDLCAEQLDHVRLSPQSTLTGVPEQAVPTLRSAFGALARAVPPETALEMIETILRDLSNNRPSSSVRDSP